MAEVVGYIVSIENGQRIDKPIYKFSELLQDEYHPHLPLVSHVPMVQKKRKKKKAKSKNCNKRRRLLSENPYCQYCGKHLNEKNSTLDHVYPRSKGGKSSMDNLVLACVPCNQKKADLLPSQFMKSLVKLPESIEVREKSLIG